MDRTQAYRLWFSTLDLKQSGNGAAGLARLRTLWEETGLDQSQQEPLRAATQIADELESRRQLVRQTRRLIREAGFDPDLLSTPAANMRGL